MWNVCPLLEIELFPAVWLGDFLMAYMHPFHPNTRLLARAKKNPLYYTYHLLLWCDPKSVAAADTNDRHPAPPRPPYRCYKTFKFSSSCLFLSWLSTTAALFWLLVSFFYGLRYFSLPSSSWLFTLGQLDILFPTSSSCHKPTRRFI